MSDSTPRRLLYVDATAGAAGDMILAALIDTGAPEARIRRALNTLPLEGWTWRATRVRRAGIAARRIEVRLRQDSPPRRLREVRRILEAGDLSPQVRRRALRVFERLFAAEARVHGRPVGQTHLHEAGAADAIVDVVGACLALEILGAERVVVSPLVSGSGRVRCAHGEYPVPAPATAELLRGVPVEAGPHSGERLTPTGAAILTTLAEAWGPLPPMNIEAVGYGAGERDDPHVANVVRVFLGTGLEGQGQQRDAEACVIEFTLDDAPPQLVAYAVERLLAEGALDVFTASVQMKKGRPGHHVTVLARPEDLARLARTIFAETTTLGLRYRREGRIELARAHERAATPWGPVRVKLGRLEGEVVQVWPEYEDCAVLARRHRVPLKLVQQAALAGYAASRTRPGRAKSR